MDLSVYAAWLRGPDISQNIQKRLKNIQKSIAELSHLAAAATRRIIVPHTTYHILDVFGLSKFKGAGSLIKISLMLQCLNMPNVNY